MTNVEATQTFKINTYFWFPSILIFLNTRYIFHKINLIFLVQTCFCYAHSTPPHLTWRKKHILQFYNVAKNSGKLQQLIFFLHLKLAATLPLSFQRFLYKLKGTLQTLLMVCLRRLVGILFWNTFCIAGRLNIDNLTTCRTFPILWKRPKMCL